MKHYLDNYKGKESRAELMDCIQDEIISTDAFVWCNRCDAYHLESDVDGFDTDRIELGKGQYKLAKSCYGLKLIN